MLDFVRSLVWYTAEEQAVLQEERDTPLLLRHSQVLPIDNGVRVVHVPPPKISAQENLPVVVLIHGLGGQACQFEHLIDYLAYFCGVIAVDYPGHGKSPPPPSASAYGPEAVVDLYSRIIEHVVPDSTTKIVAVGHSLGSITALRLSRKLGDRCAGVVTLTPPCPPKFPVSPAVQFALRWLPPPVFDIGFRASDRWGGTESISVRRMVSTTTDDVAILTKQWRVNLQSRSAAVLQTIGYMAPFTTEDAAAVSCPVLVIAAERDRVCPPSEAERLANWLSPETAGTVKLVRNAGHAILLEQPEIVQGHVADFFRTRIDENLSLAHYLAVESSKSDKWSLKNEAKWIATLAVGQSIAGLRGVKTLRQDDIEHGPRAFEDAYPNITDVIDISRDRPPYDPETFKRIRYHKFPTVSKIPPSKEQTKQFIELVKKCKHDNGGEGEIGIHCHYGFNRTGFLICSYLIDEQGFDVRTALEAFATSREPGIRHQHFIDELFLRHST